MFSLEEYIIIKTLLTAELQEIRDIFDETNNTYVDKLECIRNKIQKIIDIVRECE